MKRLLVILTVAIQAFGLWAQSIDLTQTDWYVRTGFSRTWILSAPAADDTEWLRIPAPAGNRTLTIRDLSLQGIESGGPWSFLNKEPATVTVLIPFSASFTHIAITDPALYFAHLGHNWAVYVNGVLARSEFQVGLLDRFVERAETRIVIPFGRGVVQSGSNVIAIRMAGPPNDNQFGLTLRTPYLMGSYRELSALNNEYLDMALIGVYLIFGLYILVLFFLRPREKEYLYFAIATVALTVYLASRTLLFADFIANSNIVRRVELVSMFLIMPFFFAFFDTLIKHRFTLMTKLYAAVILLLIGTSFFFRIEPFQNLWRIITPLVLVYYFIFVIGWSVVRDIIKAAKTRTDSGFRASMRTFWRFMVESDAAKIVFGSLVIILAVLFDVLRVLSGYSMFYTKYAFVVFLLGAAAMLAGRFINIYHSLETLNAGLELKVEERTAELVKASEQQMTINARIAEGNRELRAAMDEAVRDMKVAISVQKGFFPGIAPKLEGWDIALAFEVASGISGDFYDFYQKAGKLEGVLLGSVSGQGIASGLITVLTRSVFFRKFSENRGHGLPDIMFQINKELVRELASVDNNIRCTLLRIDGSRIEYANADSPDVLLKRLSDAEYSPVLPEDAPDFKAPLMGRNQFDEVVSTFNFNLASGDTLILHTDYLLQANNSKGEAYGKRRLAAALRRADTESAQSLLSSIMIDYRNFMAGSKRLDDTTVVVVRKL
ncbi:MAG: SpoIIE family protein phosphatase [Spirochaetes bacterium]|nr:SpoIIE family protein phosphatase [Spirochaetota bacterium]MBU0956421.1 SpoIIE family protein phosphatase [Spirochaetota bacterium]